MCSTGQIAGGIGGFLVGGPIGAFVGYSGATAYEGGRAAQEQAKQQKQAAKQAESEQAALLRKQKEQQAAIRATGQATMSAQQRAAATRTTPTQPMGGATGTAGVRDVLLNLGKTKLGA
jgi:hypothetical protein